MKYLIQLIISFSAIVILTGSCSSQKQTVAKKNKMKALIIDGSNNHGKWPKTTWIMKDYLEQTDIFTVDVKRTKLVWLGPHNDGDSNYGPEARKLILEEYPHPEGEISETVDEPTADPDYEPNFTDYDVIVSNFGWLTPDWPEKTQQAFEDYMKNGGGLIIVHAANNSFGEWGEYNKMIGLGGWGGRSEKTGPYVFYNDQGKLMRDPSEGACGSHGAQQEFLITIRDPDHPITRGMPAQWLHTQDELYDRLRGPAENMTILATAYSDVEGNVPPWAKNVKGTGRHEPMLMTIDYGKGRIFHTAMGHTDYSMECVGFMVSLQRGAEWAATGKVTQKIPADFPGKDMVKSRNWTK